MKMMKKIATSGLLFLAALGVNTALADSAKHVAITQIVEHPSLNAVREGLKAGLLARGYVEGDNLTWTYESAQGDFSVAGQIARKFSGLSPDVIVAISTPSAQSIASVNRKTPIVFSAVTDPLGANLVTNVIYPGGHISGISDISPIHKHVDLIREYMPKMTRLGVIYNPGEANSLCLINLLDFYSVDRHFEIVEATANRTVDVRTAAESLIDKVDAIYIPTDNTVMSAFEAVVLVGQQAGIPVFAGDTAAVERGAVAAIGFDYVQIGVKTAEMVDLVLKGSPAGSLPVETVDKEKLFVNLPAGPKMGVRHPMSVLRRADTIILKNREKTSGAMQTSYYGSFERSCNDPQRFSDLFDGDEIKVPVLAPSKAQN